MTEGKPGIICAKVGAYTSCLELFWTRYKLLSLSLILRGEEEEEEMERDTRTENGEREKEANRSKNSGKSFPSITSPLTVSEKKVMLILIVLQQDWSISTKSLLHSDLCTFVGFIDLLRVYFYPFYAILYGSTLDDEGYKYIEHNNLFKPFVLSEFQSPPEQMVRSLGWWEIGWTYCTLADIFSCGDVSAQVKLEKCAEFIADFVYVLLNLLKCREKGSISGLTLTV